MAIELAASMPPPAPPDVDCAVIDVSERAKMIRKISRIANAHGWQDAITMFLEVKGVPSMLDLTDPQLEDLLDRMNGYVDAAETGASLADCLPAG
ncbi:hypothetical protein ACYX7E_10085 [Luteimonas sp. RIT-PG2_3]